MNMACWLVETQRAFPDRPALFLGTELVADYAGFADRAKRVAALLHRQGVQPADRVAIYMANRPDYLVILYGIWIAGAAAVPINAKLHPREVMWILTDADCDTIFVAGQSDDLRAEHSIDVATAGFENDLAQQVPLEAVAERSADDLAWLFYTSGTTGQPKGVIITHGMLMSMALCYNTDVEPVRAEDATLYAAPMSHGAGLYAVMHVRAGARHVCPASGGFEAGEILSLAAHFGDVQMFAAPTMVKRLTDGARAADDRGEGLRTIVYAGGPMYNADIIDAVDWFGPKFLQIYGQGECPMGITALSRHDVSDRSQTDWEARLASVGRVQAAVELRIGGPEGESLPVGETGEIMVRGATVMPGYWRNPEATARTLRNGWLMTGDMGSLDAAGYLTLRDRSKDVIITGGSNVYPREVEEVLLAHPDLKEVSVVGREHPEWGEEVVAFIVGDVAEEALDQLCLDRIARFKRPKAYVRLAQLPKNNYGKVLKTALRDLL
ncbi:AMP-binding domain protein [Sulfitobacter noctilucae]|uniref:class I adenylate-forming enzyme family protein n=1 Tax=Sulfitobacter noctilucae TaxID=1342302 RepID=UPI0004683F7D|nr:AMP-binding protein [Sulfitobacter noctilucae]KIN60711.1 AMP-binding domain protein [Sulfitobacter noctilucae]